MRLTIDIPDNIFFAINEPKEDLKNRLMQKLALELYKSHKISISQATKLLGLDIYSFIDLLNQNSIPVIDDYDIDDEVDNVKSSLK